VGGIKFAGVGYTLPMLSHGKVGCLKISSTRKCPQICNKKSKKTFLYVQIENVKNGIVSENAVTQSLRKLQKVQLCLKDCIKLSTMNANQNESNTEVQSFSYIQLHAK